MILSDHEGICKRNGLAHSSQFVGALPGGILNPEVSAKRRHHRL